MNATTNQADPWKRPNRDDQWSRVDYRSRAAAAICVIATTLVAAVTLTAYVATRIGFAVIGDGYYTGRVTPRKLVGHLRGRSWHERDAFAGRPKNVLVVPVVSSFVWIAAACCCALRRRRQRRLSTKGI